MAEELICRLLMALEKRNEKHLYPLNVQDVETKQIFGDSLFSYFLNTRNYLQRTHRNKS